MAWHGRAGMELCICIDTGVESEWVGIVYCYMSSLEQDVKLENHHKRPSLFDWVTR